MWIYTTKDVILTIGAIAVAVWGLSYVFFLAQREKKQGQQNVINKNKH